MPAAQRSRRPHAAHAPTNLPALRARVSMVPPPWLITAPDGRVHYVADAAALLDLAKMHALVQGQRQENLLRRLVDPSNTKVRAKTQMFALIKDPLRALRVCKERSLTFLQPNFALAMCPLQRQRAERASVGRALRSALASA